MDLDLLPILVHKTKDQLTVARIDEYHYGIYLILLMRKLIIATFARQASRIRVA